MTNVKANSLDLNVGFIGLGDQGGPMAHAIGEAGFRLHVWARRPPSLQAVTGVAHTVHESVAALASACDVVALCLRDDSDVLDILERGGLLAALRADTIVVNHGTGDPQQNSRIAEDLRTLDIFYLDAPVSGGRPGAVARTLTTMAGGDRSAFEQCQPVFQAFSSVSAYMGPAGSGQTAKLLNNALTMSNLKNAVDVFDLAQKLGMDVAALFDVVGLSSGSSFILQSLGTAITPEIAPHLQGLMRKDIEHFADAVRRKGIDVDELRERGLGGANGLVPLVGLLAGAQGARGAADA